MLFSGRFKASAVKSTGVDKQWQFVLPLILQNERKKQLHSTWKEDENQNIWIIIKVAGTSQVEKLVEKVWNYTMDIT